MTEPPKIQVKSNEWHPQQAKLLQSWAEIASSYRWMHNQSYMIYKKKNMWFMLPLIVMSTVAGTANFAQSTFPSSIRPYVPQIIGAINLISAIMTTIYQFLKISEFMESHRISSINYGKLARTLTVELNLPVKDRNSGGAECVKVSRTDIDRLIEQSPAIPKSVLLLYERQFAEKGLAKPEIVVINKVDIYTDIENNTANTFAEAGLKLKNLLKKPFFNQSNSPLARLKENIHQELKKLPKLVSNIDLKSGKLSRNFFKQPIPFPKDVNLIPEIIINMDQEIPLEPEVNVIKIIEPEVNLIPEPDVIEPESTHSTHSIQTDIELLNSSKLVSSNLNKI